MDKFKNEKIRQEEFEKILAQVFERHDVVLRNLAKIEKEEWEARKDKPTKGVLHYKVNPH